MFDRYQSSHQHSEVQRVTPDHSAGPTEEFPDHQDPELYQGPFYHSYPPVPDPYQEHQQQQHHLHQEQQQHHFHHHQEQQHHHHQEPQHQHLHHHHQEQQQHHHQEQQHLHHHHQEQQRHHHQEQQHQHLHHHQEQQHQHHQEQQHHHHHQQQQHQHQHQHQHHQQQQQHQHHQQQQQQQEQYHQYPPNPHYAQQQHQQDQEQLHHHVLQHPHLQHQPHHHHHLQQQQPHHHHLQQHQPPAVLPHPQLQQTNPHQFELPDPPQGKKKKRGRPPQRQAEDEDEEVEAAKKAKRVLNRFNGMSVEEVMTRTLPDVIAHNLDILIIGINPGLLSAFKGHHYPNPGNHFWKCLFLSGLTDQQLGYMQDQDLPDRYGIGFTNMVERTTPGSKDLSSKEIREGGRQLLEKLQKYKPLIAAFNGKGIYEIFCKETFGVKAKNLDFGLQPYRIPETETVCYLMPSSSPRCAQFPRAQDKVHFYIKLKELRDQIKGQTSSGDVVETRYSFDLQLAKEDAKRISIKEEQVDPEYESCSQGPEDKKQSG